MTAPPNTSSISATVKSRNATSASTVSIAQKYTNMVSNQLGANFRRLNSEPDSLYIIMSTMSLESSFRIVHLNGTSNHTPIKKTGGLGKEYWFDPVVQSKLLSSGGDPAVVAALEDGLSAQALMGTMGMYQVRNTRAFQDIQRAAGRYIDLMGSYGLIVNPGVSPASVFTDDDTGAMRSIVMGCIMMEWKYLIERNLGANSTVAIRRAAASYLGRAGKKDINGMTPEKRVADIFNPNTDTAKILAKAGFTVPNQDQVIGGSPSYAPGRAETKVAAENDTRGIPISRNPCNAV